MKKLFILILLIISTLSANAAEVSLESKITGLYIAFFNRAADEGGLTYWTNRGNNASNQSNVLKELATGFATHPSFERAYGELSNQAFVEEIYKNALGREGDVPGINYWTGRLNLPVSDPGYLSRSDFVSVFVEAALTFDRYDPQYASLSEEDLNAAQLRQDLLANKVEVGLVFTHQLGTLTNITDNANPEENPAYLASIKILSKTVESYDTVTYTLDFLESALESDDPIEAILNWGLVFDTTPPLLTIADSDCSVLAQGDTYEAPIVTAIDAQEGNLTAQISASVSQIDTTLPGYHEVTFSVADSSGNHSNAVYKVLVTEDKVVENYPENLSHLLDASMPDALFQPEATVRIIYLVPEDKEETPIYIQVLKDTYLEMQQWYLKILDNEMTFVLKDPANVVEVVHSPQTEDWFRDESSEDVWVIFNRVVQEAEHILGTRPDNETWIIYADVNRKADQCMRLEGGGGDLGIAVMQADDLYGLSGEYEKLVCETTTEHDRWTGGGAHEAGHAFGLPHPTSVGLDCPNEECLMETGYTAYPNAILTEEGKNILRENPVFSPVPVIEAVLDMAENVYGPPHLPTRIHTEMNTTVYYRYDERAGYVFIDGEEMYVYADGVLHAKGSWRMWYEACPSVLTTVKIQEDNEDVQHVYPKVDAGSDREITVGSELLLEGNATDADGRIVHYEWSEAERVLAAEASFVYIPNTLGVHTLVLHAVDNEGLVSSDSIKVTVWSIAPQVDIGTDINAEIWQEITLNATVSDSDGNISTYEWTETINGEVYMVATGSPSFVYVPDELGPHYFTLTVTDNDGMRTSASMVLTVVETANQQPTVNAGTDKMVTVNNAITITGSGNDSDGSIVAYAWKEGTHVLSTSSSFDYIPGTVGAHILTLTITDDDGASRSDTVTVTAS